MQETREKLGDALLHRVIFGILEQRQRFQLGGIRQQVIFLYFHDLRIYFGT
jgi:hypothetical protein